MTPSHLPRSPCRFTRHGVRRFGPCPAGQAVMLQLGRLMIRGCTFSEVVYGVVVVPWEDTAHLATTVHLESNCFNTCDIW